MERLLISARPLPNPTRGSTAMRFRVLLFLGSVLLSTSGLSRAQQGEMPQQAIQETAAVPERRPPVTELLNQVDVLLSREPRYREDPPEAWEEWTAKCRAVLDKATQLSWDNPVALRVIATKAEKVRYGLEYAAFDLVTKALRRAIELKAAPDDEFRLAKLFYLQSLPPIHASERRALLQEAEKLSRAAAKSGTFERYSLLGDVLSSEQRYVEAEKQYRLALGKSSNDENRDEATRGLLWCAEGLKEYKEADRLFNEIRSKTCNDWIARGDELEQQERFSEAGDAYQAAAYNSQLKKYYCKAALMYRVQRPDESLVVARLCIEAYPNPNPPDIDLAMGHYVIADILIGRGVYSVAAEHARLATTLNPSDAHSYRDLAAALLGLRDFSGAVNAATKAIELSDGRFAYMHFDLASAYFQLGDFQRAKQSFEKAAELDPRDGVAAFNVAVCNQRLGNYPEAKQWLEESLRRSPKLGDSHSLQNPIYIPLQNPI
jgi:tetratricopeptide (TPR) repeat protein